MKRRKVLAGLGSLAAGGAAAIGTGAFTSVQADRSVTVTTSGDRDALLEIRKSVDEDGNLTANAAEYVSYDNDGLVNIDVPDANKDAFTTIRKLLDIINEGTQPVVITHEQGFAPQRVFFFHDHTTDYWTDNVTVAGEETNWTNTGNRGVTNLDLEQWGNYAYLEPGEKLKFFGIGIGIDTYDGELPGDEVTINAKTPQEYSAQDGAPSP